MARPFAYGLMVILTPSLLALFVPPTVAVSRAIAPPTVATGNEVQAIEQPQFVASSSSLSPTPSSSEAARLTEAAVEIPPPLGLLAMVCGAAFCMVASIGLLGNQSDEFVIEQDLADHEAALAEGEFLMQE